MSYAKQIERWKKLVELAKIDLDKSAETYELMQRELVNAEQQLTALKEYLVEYGQMPTTRSHWMPAQLNGHIAFGEKVHQAIAAQEQAVIEQEEVIERAKQAWFEKRAHHKAMLKMLENTQKKYQSEQDRREQKMMDELAAQKFNR